MNKLFKLILIFKYLPVTGSSLRFTDSISPNLSKYSFSCACVQKDDQP